MDTKDVKLNLQVEGNELTIRTGEALKLLQPQKIEHTGHIRAVGEFLQKRNATPGHGAQFVDASKAIVSVSRENLAIILQLDPESQLGTVITAGLKISEDLEVFQINTSKTFKRDEFIHLLRFNRKSFLYPDKHTALLAAYQKFEAVVNSTTGAESDTRGNKKFGFEKAVKTNLPDEFILSVPIFKGEQPVNFRVEICLDVTEGSARFWLESVELKELHDKLRDQFINEQLEFCKDFPIIEM